MVEFRTSERFFSRLCPPGDAQNTLLRLCVWTYCWFWIKLIQKKKKIESGRGLQISSVMVQIVNI